MTTTTATTTQEDVLQRPREPLADFLLFYLIDIMYIGHISNTLGRLWIAYEDSRLPSESGAGYNPWKAFDNTLKDSCRSMGLMASLLASASAALLVVPYVSHQAAVALLFASLSCSVISAFSAVTFLSAASYSSPAELESTWKLDKIVFVILLAGPPAWSNYALLCFKMSLLAIVWTNDDAPAKIFVTALMGFKVLQPFSLRISANGLIFALSHLFFVENLDYLRRGRKRGFAPEDDSETKKVRNERHGRWPVNPESNSPAARSGSTSLDLEKTESASRNYDIYSKIAPLPYNRDDNQQRIPSDVYDRSASRVGAANFASLTRSPSYTPSYDS